MFSKQKEKVSVEQFHTLKSRVENLSNLVVSLQKDIEIMKRRN